MPQLAETQATPSPDRINVSLRTEPRKFQHAEGDEPLSGFTIRRGVGIGGFGEVYYATSKAGKDVALKRVQRNLDIELRGVQQCLNLRHPNLVELYDIQYGSNDSPWVVMEYIGGDNLRDVIRRNSSGMSETVMRHWFKGIAAGVAYLHDHDVVHRDLKPGNIFLDNGIVKIGDYGLAKLISASRHSGQTESVGTFHYMAPEIGRGKYGRRIDIYALGVLLYEMLTGSVPFDGESSQEIIMKHLTSEPDLDKAPEKYRPVIARALAKDPDRRYATVDAMVADLELSPEYYEAPSISPGRKLGDLAIPPTIVTAESIPEPSAGSLGDEPIATALHRGLEKLRDSWDRANFSTPTKFVLLLIAVLLFILNSAWIVPTAFSLGTIYAGYLVIWMLLAPSPDRSDIKTAGVSGGAPARALATGGQRAIRQNYKYGEARLSREIFKNRSRADRCQELLGSMLLSTLVVGVLSVLMLVVGSSGMKPWVYSWAPTLAWTALTSIFGTWLVLIHAKAFESSEGDPVLRRFSMLVSGMLLGAVATSLASWLWGGPFLTLNPINPPADELTYLLNARSAFRGSEVLYHEGGFPQWLAAMGYFGGLFLALRWWKQADPLRASRLSMFTTIGCVLTAILIHLVLPYPRGFLIAATMSMALQISAPWLNRQQRRMLVDAGAPLANEA